MIGSWLNGSLRRTDLFLQTNEVNIAIRTDASSVIGSGHLMRCLAIADELKNRGDSVLFITAHYTFDAFRPEKISPKSIVLRTEFNFKWVTTKLRENGL